MIKKSTPPTHMTGLAQPATCPPPSLKMEDSKPDLTSIEYLRNELNENRKAYAYKIVDLFQSLENMAETEFFEIVSTLDGDGLQIGALIEKFRKFKKS